MRDPESKAELRHILSALATFATTFIVTAAIIHCSIRDPLHLHADERSEKLEMLKQLHGTVFSAAFGSSHVHNGFDPRAFDRALAGTPLATRTVNLAVSGGSQTEQRVMALQFVRQLESPPKVSTTPHSCQVLLELSAGANFASDHLVHPRAINIYDWQTLKFASHLTSPDMPNDQRFGRVGYAITASSLYYLNIGMLSNAIFAPPLDRSEIKNEMGDDRRGYINQPVPPGVRDQIAATFAKAPPKLPITPVQLTPGNSELIAQLAAASSVPGVAFVYVEMPLTGDVNGASDLPDHLSVQTAHGTLLVPIINLARPDRFPSLYQADMWHDGGHLNDAGAKLLSETLAQQLKLWYAAHGMPPHCGG